MQNIEWCGVSFWKRSKKSRHKTRIFSREQEKSYNLERMIFVQFSLLELLRPPPCDIYIFKCLKVCIASAFTLGKYLSMWILTSSPKLSHLPPDIISGGGYRDLLVEGRDGEQSWPSQAKDLGECMFTCFNFMQIPELPRRSLSLEQELSPVRVWTVEATFALRVKRLNWSLLAAALKIVKKSGSFFASLVLHSLPERFDLSPCQKEIHQFSYFHLWPTNHHVSQR